MTLGLAISIFAVVLLALTFALCAAASRADDDAEIIERRLRDIAKTAPDHPGVVLPFERRRS